jgi:hypothetical protein
MKHLWVKSDNWNYYGPPLLVLLVIILASVVLTCFSSKIKTVLLLYLHFCVLGGGQHYVDYSVRQAKWAPSLNE